MSSLRLESIEQEFRYKLFKDERYEPRRWKANGELRKIIDDIFDTRFNSLNEKIWALKQGCFQRPTCSCGKLTSFGSITAGYRKFCSKKCAASSEETKATIKATQVKNWGGHYTQNKKWQEDFVSRCKKAGSYEKMMQTFSEKYDVTNRFELPHVKAAIISTNIMRYGVSNPMQNIDVRNKAKKTCEEKYGVSHPMQSPEIFERCQASISKSRYALKTITMPSGTQRKVQGYEPFVIDYFLQAGISEADLLTDRCDVPTIRYAYMGKDRTYFPDMFIPSKHMLVEVKSTYTWQKDLAKNLAKHEAAKKLGYNHIIIIWDTRRNCIDTII
jgi:hypothetical protein